MDDKTDFQAMHDELTKGFIIREYEILNPNLGRPFCDVEEKAIDMYRKDGYFRRRIDSVVGGVINIVQKHVRY